MLTEILHRVGYGLLAGNAVAIPVLVVTGVAIAALPFLGVAVAVAAPKRWRFS